MLRLILGLALLSPGCSRETPPTDSPTALSRQVTKGNKGKRKRAAKTAEASLTNEQQELVRQLEALGYVGADHEATDQSGVTLHDPMAEGGLNLYTTGGFQGAVLMDMDGVELHRWSHPLSEIFSDPSIDPTTAEEKGWRRAWLLDEGHLLGLVSGFGIFRLDAESNVVWARRCNAHHDLQVLPDGRIWVLTRRAHMVPDLDRRDPISEDYLTLLSADGEVLREISVLAAFRASPDFPAIWAGRDKRSQDVFHTNSLQILNDQLTRHGPAFDVGHVLTSMRNLDAIAVIDPDEEIVTWSLRGGFARQHDPRPLANGRILLFDNQGAGDHATVLEIDPSTEAVHWLYGGTKDHPFDSPTCGLSERLASGQTLIIESAHGRAFQVTPEGERVWEFHNPQHIGDLVGRLFEFRRLPPSTPIEWAR